MYLGLAMYAGILVNRWGTYFYHEKYGRDKLVEGYIDSVFDSEYISQAKALGHSEITAAPHYFGDHDFYENTYPWIPFSDARIAAVTNEQGEIFFFSAEFRDSQLLQLRDSVKSQISEMIRHEATHSIVARICPNARVANRGEKMIDEGFAYLMGNGTGKINCSGSAGVIPKVSSRIPEYERAACFVEPIWKSFGLAGICYAIRHAPSEDDALLEWRAKTIDELSDR